MVYRTLIAVVCLVQVVSGAERLRAVPTFECVGLYWRAEAGAADNACKVRFRQSGQEQWREGLDLWFDGREMSPVGRGYRGEKESRKWEHGNEYRGSIVGLKAGTTYEVQLRLEKTGHKRAIEVKTWAEDFPVGQKVVVANRDQTLVVDKGGSAGGYVLYTGGSDKKTGVIDVKGRADQCIEIRRSHVIIDGLVLRNAAVHAIRVYDGCHDIVIRGCDISGWGRISEDGWGKNLDSAVYSRARDLARVIVERNVIHDPRADGSNWREKRPRPGKREPYHSEGPQAVYFRDSEGNHVIRYNTVYSDEEHCYNDIFGAGSNFSTRGFPNRDSDIYGNLLSNCWDDAIESEGANRNVRIWGNYMTDCFVGVACAGTSVGPLYVWRNVTGRMRVAPGEWSGGFLKTSDIMGGGRVFVFHNTVTQPYVYDDEGRMTGGARIGIGWGGPLSNVTTRNNVWNVKSRAFRNKSNDPLGDYDYDLYRGSLPQGGHEKHGVKGEPKHIEGFGFADGKGVFSLRESSPGYDAGIRLPNFNDNFTGKAPDFGAHEAGNPPMQFGAGAGGG